MTQLSKIEFSYTDTKFCLFNEESIHNWLANLILKHGKRLKGLNYTFMSDDELLDINIKYLNHDYYTDIITFNSNRFDFVSGDIYISVDRIEDFSRGTNKKMFHELLRVIAHGCLHLIGFDDKNETDKMEMRRQEDIAIDIYLKEFHADVPRETK